MSVMLATTPKNAVLLLAAFLTTMLRVRPSSSFRSCAVTPMTEYQDVLPVPDMLGETRGVEGAWGCVRLCVRTPGCQSLSHHPDTEHCVLYGQPLPALDQISPAPGYVFFLLCPASQESTSPSPVPSSSSPNPHTSTSQMGESSADEASVMETVATKFSARYAARCTLTSQCGYQHAECRVQTCSCEAGYSFLNATGDCVPTCDTYGSTFYRVPNRRVRLLNDVVLLMSTLEECLRHCIMADKFLCRSAEYLPSIRECHLCSATALSHPQEWEPSALVDYYQRNCA